MDDMRMMPVARTQGLVTQAVMGEMLVYDLQSHKAHCLNRPAALVWGCCDGRTSLSQAARKVQAELGVPVSDEIVLYALGQLDAFRLLQADEQERAFLTASQARTPGTPGKPGMSRRDFIRKAGITTAVAITVPVIASIVAPTAAQAASCLPNGSSCSDPAQCCSGLCSGGFCA